MLLLMVNCRHSIHYICDARLLRGAKKQPTTNCLKPNYSISDAITEHQVNKFKYKPCLRGSCIIMGKSYLEEGKLMGWILFFHENEITFPTGGLEFCRGRRTEPHKKVEVRKKVVKNS